MTEQERTAHLITLLQEKLLKHTSGPCNLETNIPGFRLVRREDSCPCERCFEKPLAGLVVSGEKHSMMGGRDFVYSTGQSVVAGLDMPMSSWVAGASPENPFLFVCFYLDRSLVTSLVLDMKERPLEPSDKPESVSIIDTDADILEMFLRLIELNEKPEQVAIRAPLMLREVHYLLLLSPHGRLLRQLNTPGTRNNNVVKAVNWIRENYRESTTIDDLARLSGMSSANLHRHFKLMTGLSPVQYQKQMRLFEAQRLMLVENETASGAAFSVGYESVTQFNREYKRCFGEPPLRDMARRRAAMTS